MRLLTGAFAKSRRGSSAKSKRFVCGLAVAPLFALGALAGTITETVAAETLAAVPGGGSCGRAAPAVDPFRLYGDEIKFQVRRNGTPVGTHTVGFARDANRLMTETRFEVAIDVLFFTAYRYVYESRATWRDGCLLALDARTDDDGDESVVRVRSDGPRLSVSGPSGTTSVAADELPTEHWDAAVLGRNAVINTINGRIDAVAIAQIGTEPVRRADGATIPARHFVYSGDLRNEVWYDGEGRWVKMRFAGSDGSTIDYVCVKCARDGSRSQP